MNLVPAQSSIHVLTRVFEKKKVDEVYMFFSLLLNENKNSLLENKNNKTLNDITLIKSCNLAHIVEKYKLLSSVKSSSFIRSNTSNIKPIEQKKNQMQIREDETHS